jgi:hypothetical protein
MPAEQRPRFECSSPTLTVGGMRATRRRTRRFKAIRALSGRLMSPPAGRAVPVLTVNGFVVLQGRVALFGPPTRLRWIVAREAADILAPVEWREVGGGTE